MKQFSGTADQVRQRFAEVRERVDEAARQAGRRRRRGRDPGRHQVRRRRRHGRAARRRRRRSSAKTAPRTWSPSTSASAAPSCSTSSATCRAARSKLVLPLVRLIHSVSTKSVVEELQARAQNPVDVLLEVNIAGEESKSGVALDRSRSLPRRGGGCDKVSFAGLMCMPPLCPTRGQAAPHFAHARRLAADLSTRWAGRYTFARVVDGHECRLRGGGARGCDDRPRRKRALLTPDWEERWA